MTPDAAGVVARVDAGLLIALTVDAKSRKQGTEADDMDADTAWLYFIGIASIVASISMTLTTIIYGRPLSGLAQHIVMDTTAIGFLPLISGAIDRISPKFRSKK